MIPQRGAVETEAPYVKRHKENRSFFRRLSVANTRKNPGRLLGDEQTVLSFKLGARRTSCRLKYHIIDDNINRNKTKSVVFDFLCRSVY